MLSQVPKAGPGAPISMLIGFSKASAGHRAFPSNAQRRALDGALGVPLPPAGKTRVQRMRPFPGPRVRGTWGTHFQADRVLKSQCRSIVLSHPTRKGARWMGHPCSCRTGLLKTCVLEVCAFPRPKCEGQGAPRISVRTNSPRPEPTAGMLGHPFPGSDPASQDRAHTHP
jgi:hypothetical protein